MRFSDYSRRHAGIALFAAQLLAFSNSAFAVDGELPALRSGLWEITRPLRLGDTVKELTVTKCTDPIATMKSTREGLIGLGCTYSPVSQQGNVYTYTSDCKSAGGLRRTEATLTVEGDSGYLLEEKISGGDGPTINGKMAGKRVGDC